MEMAALLRNLVSNLWWSWHPSTVALFRDIDPDLWSEVNHNPVLFLNRIAPERLEQRAAELALETRVNFALHRLQDYLDSRRTWGHIHCGVLHCRPVAYFSAEFALHESIPIYSGGLGVLAGDHLKAASDLGVPVVGVGLFYAQAYFSQRLDASGWQKEDYSDTNVQHLPFERVTTASGEPVEVEVETRGGTIRIAVWRMLVGRNSVYLLDSNVPGNSDSDRQLTGRLYGGDHTMRIRQELILGVGGVRALLAVGIRPGVLHLNEGHSVFAILELVRQRMADDALAFDEAFRRVATRTVFVTHTPVAAGHDRFDANLVEEVLGLMREKLGLSRDQFMDLGRVKQGDGQEPFCMTVLGLRSACRAKAVSALHGHISRHMWQPMWPSRDESEVPIGHITNGVHVFSWIAQTMRQLFDSHLGGGWDRRICQPETWARVDSIDDGELWEAHQVLKARLVDYTQRRICRQESYRQADRQVCDIARERLSPNVLTIGFGRRFATYKRADLILSDEGLLEKLVLDPERPIQLIFAGKAHPNDDPGKQLIQRIFRMSIDPRFRGRIVFLEDYDINLARHLIQGVDVWLNTPLKPHEASGTSGMKVLFNGVLNLSILDGWWAEAYDGNNGFTIGAGGQHSDASEQSRRDAAALYATLIETVIPLYYERNGNGVPPGWVVRMKRAMKSLAWRFNASRMIMDYARECYLPLVGACTSSCYQQTTAGGD